LSSKNEGEGETEKGIELTIRMPGRIVPRRKRAKIVLRRIREAASRVAKEKEIKISPDLSEMVWSRGIEKPPKTLKISVIVEDDEDFATVIPSGVERKS